MTLPIRSTALAISLLMTTAVTAQEVKVIESETQENVEIIVPETDQDVEKPAPTTATQVDVVEPSDTVSAEAGELGEAPTVDGSRLVELDDDFVLPTLNVPVYALDDYDLVDRNGNGLGEVEEVLGPNENTATAVAIEFDGPGWFFNDADITRVVDISYLSIHDDKLVLDLAEDDVRALPVYQDD